MLVLLAALSAAPALAHGGSGLGPLPAGTASPSARVEVLPGAYLPGALDAAFTDAAAEFGVPKPLLMAVGYEATHWRPISETPWGGWGMFDLREGAQDPSLEHAAALLEVDPNRLITDWRLNLRGAAAILADQARLANGGVAPALDDWAVWWNATRAFSGRQEPNLQDDYAEWVFSTIEVGLSAETVWGVVRIDPTLTGYDYDVPPPPPSTDSSLAAQWVAACSDNYSNYSRTSSDISMVVIHTVQGGYSSCYNWFANCSAGASAHYVVRSSDGEITQMVREADVAWHAGNWDYNLVSVGIEHEGYIDDPSYLTDAMYAASAALTADIAARQGVSLDRSRIIGHDEVPDPDGSGYGGSGHHTDPGGYWDWDYYMALVTGSGGVSGGDILGVVADSDIYNGERLVGATVWIAETGEYATTDSSGIYTFSDVPFGSYTMHATYPGYAEGTCTKTTSGSQDWCSIALYPDSGGDNGGEDSGSDNGGGNGGEDSGTEDSGVTDDDTAVDTGPDHDPEGEELQFPGAPVPEREVGGCAAVGRPAPSIAVLLGVVALLRRRR